MPFESEGKDSPNWWLIVVFTTIGAGLLMLAYYLSSYWQGVLVNGGTALLLFALLVFSEPRLVHHLRRPRNLHEALAEFNALVTLSPLFSRGNITSPSQIRDRVLSMVGKTGLHQEFPKPSSARFMNLGGAVEVQWCVEWDEGGLRHVVTADGRRIPNSLTRCIGWDKKIKVHEERVYKILCYLLRELEHQA